MDKILADIVNGKLIDYVQALAKELKLDEEAIRIVIKIEKKSLGIFLFNGSKFLRRLELVEFVKLLMPQI